MNKRLGKICALGIALVFLLSMLLLQGCTQREKNQGGASSSANHVSGSSSNGELTPNGGSSTSEDETVKTPAGDDLTSDDEYFGQTGGKKPENNDPPKTDNEKTDNDTTEKDPNAKYPVTYKDYEAMTPEQQLAYQQSFDKLEDYIAWLKWAKAEDTDDGEHVEAEDGVIDLEELLKP